MTAEIVILNRSAVALAADSAVTITTQSGQKIYNTVNKLFTLSKYEPVGVMVFGSAELHGVPWELIIKMYRRELDRNKFNTLRQSADGFLDWIVKNRQLFPDDVRTSWAWDTIGGFLRDVIRGEIDNQVTRRLRDGEQLTDEDVGQVVDELLNATESDISSRPDTEYIRPDQATEIIPDDSAEFARIVAEVFEQLPLGDGGLERLRRISRALLHKKYFSNSSTGLVVAGYGDDEAFPAIVHFQIDGLLPGGAKASLDAEWIVGRDGSASIQPFAQREMVDTFIAGIAPEYEQALGGFVTGLMEQLPSHVGSQIADDTVRATVEQTIKQIGQQASKHFEEQRRRFTQERFVDPIVSAVEVLPKEELAEMAESLVNLTSFKRRVSMGEVETVGGPIDVAVISKGDGFIWIRRKHYFQAEANPQYFANYNR